MSQERKELPHVSSSSSCFLNNIGNSDLESSEDHLLDTSNEQRPIDGKVGRELVCSKSRKKQLWVRSGLVVIALGVGALACWFAIFGRTAHEHPANPKGTLRLAIKEGTSPTWRSQRWNVADLGQDEVVESNDFCAKHENDMEFHTRRALRSVENIASVEMCCAECDGDPQCAAWTYGADKEIEDVGGVCFLKALAENEIPMRVRRPGLISGLLQERLHKHGVVAKLVQGDTWQKGETQQETAIRANETCPGPLRVAGLGALRVSSARWLAPGEQAAKVRTGMQDNEVEPMLSGRAYLATNCSVSISHQEDLMGLKLLGKTLRYSVDMSGAGCGCMAQLHLAPLGYTDKPSECGDFHCDVSGSCGNSCPEVAVQDANQYAWSTSLHVLNDTEGIRVGYGGMKDKTGRRNWDDESYGPNASCIDTHWPFNVAMSFFVDGDGKLDRLEVLLSQDTHDCTLSARIDTYDFQSRDGLREFSATLDRGVTPVISYWSSDDLQWLDGVGADGKGPCVRDSPEACPASVRFYGFGISDASGVLTTALEETVASPLQGAIAGIHDFLEEKARKKVSEEIEAEVEREEIKHDGMLDCVGDCTMNLGDKRPSGPYIEMKSDNIEWRVKINVFIRKEKSFTADILGQKLIGEVITGERQGDWVKIANQEGYLAVQRDGANFLEELVVTYEKIVSGNCHHAGLFPIKDQFTCRAAGFALGYFDAKVNLFSGPEEKPEGCYIFRGGLWVADHPSNQGNGAMEGREPICSSRPYATTTTTTTTKTTSTKSTTTMTTTTITTTTWGTPSLFCFLVMMRSTYEYGLVKEQVKRRVGIFSTCDEHAVFSQDAPFSLGRIFHGNGAEVKAQWFQKAKVGKSEDGTAGNALLFVHVFQAIKKDGRFRRLDWTIKADPDAVVLPERIRKHLGRVKEPFSYLVNCNKMNYKPPFPMIFGAFEAFARESLEKFLDHGGVERCMKQLPYQRFGEDKFMGNCMKMLGSHEFDDFQVLADKRCLGANCKDGVAGAYHDFKGIPEWFKCWDEATST